ncbi:terminase large subunit [Sinorhizobium medicae]|nr:terminase large subunit [Sinorhizobium medicae]
MGLRGPGAKRRNGTNDIMNGKPLRITLPWQKEGLSRVGRIIAFLEDLPVTQGTLAGTKLKLRPWQVDFIRAVYATDPETGHRPVRTAVLSLARKNGKTVLTAGLALCHLLGPEAEERGEIFACANDKNQAKKAWGECKAILEAHPELLERVNIIRFNAEIEVLEGKGKGSIFKALSADADTKLGLSPSFCIMDELGYARDAHLYDAMNTAMGARSEPLLMAISTQARDDNQVFSRLIDYGIKIREGEAEPDPHFHLTLFTAPVDADPWHPDTWATANPALGDFRSLEDVRRQAAQAQRSPTLEMSFRNLILNQRIDANVRFIARAEWDANNKGEIDPDELVGRECWAGLDLSAKRDLTAWVLVFPNGDGTFEVLPRFFLPDFDIAGKSDNDRVPYDVWSRDEKARLTLLAGKAIDPRLVAEWIAEDAARFNIKGVAYDRWRIDDLRRELEALSVELPLIEHGQGFKEMGKAVDTLELLVAEARLNHENNAILKMCASNAVCTSDAAGNRKLDKAKASGRIDGLVALAMALSIAERKEESWPACFLEFLD